MHLKSSLIIRGIFVTMSFSLNTVNHLNCSLYNVNIVIVITEIKFVNIAIKILIVHDIESTEQTAFQKSKPTFGFINVNITIYILTITIIDNFVISKSLSKTIVGFEIAGNDRSTF